MISSRRAFSAPFRVLMAAFGLAVAGPAVAAQSETASEAPLSVTPLFAGDSIRVDRDLVGRVLSIEGQNLTVVWRGTPRCRAGERHGDAPLCDPAPMLRRVVDLSEVSIERRMAKSHLNLRTLAGGMIGAAAFGTAGYFIGPAWGFGKVDRCLSGDNSATCQDPAVREPLLRKQKSADQRKGVLFFGVIGGSFTAIMARKLSVGWVRIEPSLPVNGAAWGASFVIPTPR